MITTLKKGHKYFFVMPNSTGEGKNKKIFQDIKTSLVGIELINWYAHGNISQFQFIEIVEDKKRS